MHSAVAHHFVEASRVDVFVFLAPIAVELRDERIQQTELFAVLVHLERRVDEHLRETVVLQQVARQLLKGSADVGLKADRPLFDWLINCVILNNC